MSHHPNIITTFHSLFYKTHNLTPWLNSRTYSMHKPTPVSTPPYCKHKSIMFSSFIHKQTYHWPIFFNSKTCNIKQVYKPKLQTKLTSLPHHFFSSLSSLPCCFIYCFWLLPLLLLLIMLLMSQLMLPVSLPRGCTHVGPGRKLSLADWPCMAWSSARLALRGLLQSMARERQSGPRGAWDGQKRGGKLGR